MKEVTLAQGMVIVISGSDNHGDRHIIGVFSKPDDARRAVEHYAWHYESVRIDEISVDEVKFLNLDQPDTESPMGAGLWRIREGKRDD